MKAQPQKKRHWLRWVLMGIGATLICIVLVGCYIIHQASKALFKLPQVADEPAPCATPAQLALGYPHEGDASRTAYFTTDGSNVYISAYSFNHGGFFDPTVGNTLISIGDANTTPSLDPQTDQVANTQLQLSVEEGKHKKAQLPAGRYWLWSSTGGDVRVQSCGKLSS